MELEPIKDMHVSGKTSISELAEEYLDSGGFVAKHLGMGVKILEKMFSEDCYNFLSFPACIIATGTRGIIRDLIKEKKFNAVITTCGTLDHDLARIWKDYYHGHFLADDKELHEKGINRLGNIFVPNESYGIVLEKKLQPILKDIYDSGKRDLASYELVWEIGKRLEGEEKAEESIVYWAWKNRIPVFIPGITDGAVGSQIWMFRQDHKDFNVNVFKDEDKLADIVFSNKKTGALMIGGGISKHHTIWWNQFKDGLDYAVYVTTAVEWDGSLSGARVREAVSWGKVKENAKYVTIEGDATVILPLLVAKFMEK